MDTNLTNQDYSNRKRTHYVAKQTYSYLNKSELDEIRSAIALAYPTHTLADQKRQFVTLACQPTAAARFVEKVKSVHGMQGGFVL